MPAFRVRVRVGVSRKKSVYHFTICLHLIEPIRNTYGYVPGAVTPVSCKTQKIGEYAGKGFTIIAFGSL
jgi:hypothetical protein